MSDFSSGNEVISGSEGGVTIEKSFDGEEFAVPAIRFELQSDHDDAVTVRLTDRIPDDFPMDNVGFHPEYENENWTAYKDHRVQFERTLEPNESLTTVYGIRLSNWSDAEKFLIEPELEEVTPVTGDAKGQGEERMEEHTITDIVSEDSSQVVRDVITGDSGLPGLDESEANDDAADPLADDGNDPLGDDEDDPLADPLASAAKADNSTETEAKLEDDFEESPLDDDDDLENETDSPFDEPVNEPDAVAGDFEESDDIIEASDEMTDEPPVSPPRPGSVAAALADEIRAGEVNGDDLKLIQQELDLDTPESTNVRIRHLQSRVDDLAAYTEALEEFIDDNGTAKTLIDGFETEVESVRTELDEMDDEIESAKDESAQARARVADFETTVESLETGLERDIEAIEDDMDELGELDSTLDGLESQLDDLEDLVATNTQEASALDDELEDLRDDFETLGSLEGMIGEVSDDVSELSDSVAATETRMDEKVETLRADIENIESELKEVNEWRDQLGSVFGGN
ncbi:AAA family ATPase [Haladaptatus sp. DYF46]|uniref:AAA family ATPase n=1 Tax=Haladaptatus sp. DYF46 TaxID=2886041 RepID=UPI001E2876C8|nr:AAA family ATPase [Haladaptatus sp. DYF46]